MATSRAVRFETRVCPGCQEEKSFPVRNQTCSNECRWRLERGAKAPVVMEPALRSITADEARVRDLIASHRGIDITDICNTLDLSPAKVEAAVKTLQAHGYNIAVSAGDISLSDDFAPTRRGGEPAHVLVHPVGDFSNHFRKIGACGDNHLGSNHERLDVLNALYDLYEAEGVKDVYNTGNWIEGVSRLNKHDIKIHGFGDQVDYFIEKYPARRGITTHFVAGDDHEGWLQKAERIEIGRYAEAEARRAGRQDLHYLGYVEADVVLRAAHGERLMKIMHPGGGSAYATSYAPQKLIESFQGGEKPEILLLGHYHKFDHGHYRGVHYVQTGCTVDQSIFMRKNKISAAVGGCLISFNQAPDGAINRFSVEWIPFYNKGYYTSPREFGLTPAPDNLIR